MIFAFPATAKTVLRLHMRGLRKRLAAETPGVAEVAARLAPQGLLASAPIVAGYRPQGAEIDPWPLMQAFAEAGARLALPVALHRDEPLAFRAYADGHPLTPDVFGVPAPTPLAEIVRPGLVIAPLLAFDRWGGRMGQGGGHYDRTLAELRASGPVFVLGLAYAGQEVARLPAEPHDQRLDAILTEKGYMEAAKEI